MKIYRGSIINSASIITLVCNGFYFFRVDFSESLLAGVVCLVLLNILFYFIFRDKFNYFLLAEDKIIVRNPLRPRFQNEVYYRDIRFVDKDHAPKMGTHLALATPENPGMRINCSGLSDSQIDQVISDLLMKIKK